MLLKKKSEIDKFDDIQIKFQSEVTEKEYKKVLLPPRFFVLPTFEKLTEIIKQAIAYKKTQSILPVAEMKSKKQSVFKKL